MKNQICILLLLFLSTNLMFAKGNDVSLWYDTPADEWMKSLPIGNGRLAAMVYGGIDNETIALNESSMWSGEYDKHQEQPFGKQRLNDLRKLFFEGKLVEGNKLAGKYLSGTPHSFGTHLPIGDLKLDFIHSGKEVTDYHRSLSLNEGIGKVSYCVGGVHYTREYFATNPDDVIVIRVTADKKKSISAALSLSLLREAQISTEDNQLIFNGKATFPKLGTGGVCFEGRISVKAPRATVQMASDKVTVDDADELTIVIDIRTDYKNSHYRDLCKKTVYQASSKSYKTLKKKHINDFRPLFERVSLNIEGEESFGHLPVDRRWKRLKEGKADEGLAALFFQYGRYLLLAASRANSPLPVALQGPFNDNLACHMCWTSDYHLDINTQQNYWIANVGNLAECNLPLFSYIKDLSVHGAKTAQVVYGCKGWTAHTVANIWGFTAPSAGIGYGLFPTASSWMASHLWTQYEYTLDKKYLAETAYPLLKGNAEFLLDYMTESPDGKYLMTGPSVSPENAFRYQNKSLCASMMPTCDRVLVYETLNACLQAAAILNIDKTFQDTLKLALDKLPPIRLRANGAVREWFEDYEEAVPNHRHTTHLLALYPFSQISLDKTPQLASGARKTIEGRLSAKNWEDVEWSRANMMCFYARLKDADEAYKSTQILLRDFTRENLLSISPKGIAGAPYDIFIFDGNAAGAAGIGEMLIQNHEGYIEFLPCLPKQWKKGSYSGLCVRGGAEVAAEWDETGLRKASITAKNNNEYAVKLPVEGKYILTLNRRTVSLAADARGVVTLPMQAGDKLTITQNKI